MPKLMINTDTHYKTTSASELTEAHLRTSNIPVESQQEKQARIMAQVQGQVAMQGLQDFKSAKAPRQTIEQSKSQAQSGPTKARNMSRKQLAK